MEPAAASGQSALTRANPTESADYQWDSSQTTYITLNGDSITVDGDGAVAEGSRVTIITAGTYSISGHLDDGQIIVNTDDAEPVGVILNGIDINHATGAPIYVESAEETVIVLADGTENYVSDSASYVFENTDDDEPNAAIFSKDELTIEGSGTLTVVGNYNDAIASTTSHELRTPLTTMRLRTEALRYDASLTEEDRQQYAVEIDEELVRLSGLAEDLILLSRFDAGRAELGEERIDLDRFAHNMYQSFAAQAAEKGITLQLEVQRVHPTHIEASLNHLKILFRNLLDNAIKYTPTGGTVVWRIAATDEQAIFTVQEPGRASRRSTCRTCLNASTAPIKPARAVFKGLGWVWRWRKPLSRPMLSGSRSPARGWDMAQPSRRTGP
jgi:signal transduction histidine kinase